MTPGLLSRDELCMVNDEPVSHLPPDVLIAAGVEALRRVKRGWGHAA